MLALGHVNGDKLDTAVDMGGPYTFTGATVVGMGSSVALAGFGFRSLSLSHTLCVSLICEFLFRLVELNPYDQTGLLNCLSLWA